MQVDIQITLTNEDIEAGLTAEAAVARVFPHNAVRSVETTFEMPDAPAAGAQVRSYDLDSQVEKPFEDLKEEQLSTLETNTSADTPLAGAEDVTVATTDTNAIAFLEENGIELDAELDITDCPWCKAIHSSNRDTYKKGAKAGKEGQWMWKRGTIEAEREELAQQLRDAIKSATVAAPEVAEAGVSSEAAGSTVSMGPPGQPDNEEPPANAGPPGAAAPQQAAAAAEQSAPANSAPPGADAAAPAAEGGIKWPAFLQALKGAGLTHADVAPHLAEHQLEKMIQLSVPDNDAILQAVARTMGFVA